MDQLISPELLENLKKKLVELTAAWGQGLCWGECVDRITGDTIVLGHGACHSWVTRGFTSYRRTKGFIVLNCHPTDKNKRSSVDKKDRDSLLLWMAKESIYSRFFLNRDDEESLLNGGAILLCGGKDGLNEVQALWVCKVLRHMVEGGSSVTAWARLVDRGVHPMVALALGSYLGISLTEGVAFKVHPVCQHVSVFSTHGDGIFPEETLRNMLKGDDKSLKNYLTQTNLVFGWDKQGPKAFTKKSLEGMAKPVLVDDGWGSVSRGEGVDIEDVAVFARTIQEKLLNDEK